MKSQIELKFCHSRPTYGRMLHKLEIEAWYKGTKLWNDEIKFLIERMSPHEAEQELRNRFDQKFMDYIELTKAQANRFDDNERNSVVEGLVFGNLRIKENEKLVEKIILKNK